MLELTEPDDRTIEVEVEEAPRSAVTAPLFRLGRAIFGGILGFMALDNLRNLQGRIEYAKSKGAPAPKVTVPTVSTGLLLGSLGIALWRRPKAAAIAVAGFFVSVTPLMHDFWNEDDPQQRQQQLTHFLKNAALLGATLVFLRFGRRKDD